MRIDWNNKDSFKRLLAAMVAAQEVKLNYGKIATMYGQGATYDAIEGHFRKIRKEAIQLRQDHDAQATTVSSSSNTVPTTSRKSRAKRAPRKEKAEAGQSVLGGRIKKPSAPARKPKAIKQEVVKEEGDALRETDAEAEMILGSPSATISFDTTDDIWLSRQNSFSRGFGI